MRIVKFENIIFCSVLEIWIADKEETRTNPDRQAKGFVNDYRIIEEHEDLLGQGTKGRCRKIHYTAKLKYMGN